MPVQIDLLRAILGALCVMFAHFLGRSAVRVYQGKMRQSRAVTWALRTAVTLLGVFWRRGFDKISVIVMVLAAAALVLGAWDEWRPKDEEDLSKALFPKE